MGSRIRTVLVSVLAIALLGWFLRHANLADVWLQVRRARVDLLLLALPPVALTYWIRAIRWQYLLAPVGPTRFSTALRATVIGFAAMSVLPARAGDVLRPYLLARQEGLSATATFATIVVERILDLIAVLTLLALFVWGFATQAELPPALMRSVQVTAGLAGLASIALMVIMAVLAGHPERIGGLVLSAGRFLPAKLGAGLAKAARTFSEGLAVAREPRGLLIAVAWSFPLWIVIASETWLVTRAFGIDMPASGSFLLQALLVIGVAVPTPGAVGGFHEAYRIGVTTFFGAPNDAAIGAAIVLHAISFVPVTVAGAILMANDGLSVGRLRDLSRQDPAAVRAS